ncbi:hypothetical protein K5X82_01685 [Halosquirtibacter xylanolyticus]|uniref:hypothetical protein n=1 Tax=Halosquirtibacter xylanolyticus TaxID=3374599 RepID=UPI003749944A|nr:hypothetical protein K5X82_01685 [Prolixibacteraceae bacterium]
MKRIILIVCILLSFKGFSQKELSRNTYLYGSIKNKLEHNVLIVLDNKDAKSEYIMKQSFRSKMNNIFTLNQLVFPGEVCGDSQYKDLLKEKDIKTVLNVSVYKREFGYKYGWVGQNGKYMDGSNGSINSDSYAKVNAGEEIKYLALKLDIYTSKDDFKKPIAVIVSDKYRSSSLGNEELLYYRSIIQQLSKGLARQFPFKK